MSRTGAQKTGVSKTGQHFRAWCVRQSGCGVARLARDDLAAVHHITANLTSCKALEIIKARTKTNLGSGGDSPLKVAVTVARLRLRSYHSQL